MQKKLAKDDETNDLKDVLAEQKFFLDSLPGELWNPLNTWFPRGPYFRE